MDFSVFLEFPGILVTIGAVLLIISIIIGIFTLKEKPEENAFKDLDLDDQIEGEIKAEDVVKPVEVVPSVNDVNPVGGVEPQVSMAGVNPQPVVEEAAVNSPVNPMMGDASVSMMGVNNAYQAPLDNVNAQMPNVGVNPTAGNVGVEGVALASDDKMINEVVNPAVGANVGEVNPGVVNDFVNPGINVEGTMNAGVSNPGVVPDVANDFVNPVVNQDALNPNPVNNTSQGLVDMISQVTANSMNNNPVGEVTNNVNNDVNRPIYGGIDPMANVNLETEEKPKTIYGEIPVSGGVNPVVNNDVINADNDIIDTGVMNDAMGGNILNNNIPSSSGDELLASNNEDDEIETL